VVPRSKCRQLHWDTNLHFPGFWANDEIRIEYWRGNHSFYNLKSSGGERLMIPFVREIRNRAALQEGILDEFNVTQKPEAVQGTDKELNVLGPVRDGPLDKR
jgi:hypothetical protein